MSIAKIEITCTECGRTFTHRKECRNRSEADSYEAWAGQNIDTCPECWRKIQANQNAAALAVVLKRYGIRLPDLSGESDKQIDYAGSVRARYLCADLRQVERYCKVMSALNDPEQAAKFARICEENGISVEEGIKQNIHALRLEKINLMMTATEAGMILDAK